MGKRDDYKYEHRYIVGGERYGLCYALACAILVYPLFGFSALKVGLGVIIFVFAS
jgi:hypothetical protein